MAQEFEYHRRGVGCAGLAVTAVPDGTTGPLRLEVLTDVGDNLALDEIAEGAAHDAVAASLFELAISLVAQGVDCKRADC